MAPKNNFPKLDKAAVEDLLQEITDEYAPILAAQAQKLKKAAEESASGEDEGSEVSAPPSKDEGSAPPAEGSAPPEASPDAGGSPPPPVDGSAPPSAPPMAPGAPGADGSAPPNQQPQDPFGGLPTDPAALSDMISKLPPEAVKAVYLAAKQALYASMGGGAGAPPSAPPAGPPEMSAPPPAAPPGPPAGPEASAPPPFGKGEMKSNPANGDDNASTKNVAKSETASEKALKAELADLKKAQTETNEILKRTLTLMAQPQRKAITGISQVRPIAKSEGGDEEPKTLSKSEVSAKLKEKARTDLSKKDRQAINRFYDTGSKDLGLIEHLLK